jgi:superfamily II DNA/RNA helicase
MRFADIGLSDELLKAVTEAGYDEPTPIQAAAIPQVQMMRDLIAIAQTGTGKTASFVLPMIDVLANGRARARMPRRLPKTLKNTVNITSFPWRCSSAACKWVIRSRRWKRVSTF